MATVGDALDLLDDDQLEVFWLIVEDAEGYDDDIVAGYLGVEPADVKAFRKANA